jgi:hypothetical protein
MIPLMQYASDLETLDPGALGALMAVWLGFMVFFIVFAVIAYIYMGLTVMKTAQRIKVGPAWLAWVPIANVYLMLKMGKQPWWPMLLLIGMVIPFVNFIAMIVFMVFMIIAQWKICEARQRPGWWAIIMLVPLVGSVWSFIMWGILAWGK